MVSNKRVSLLRVKRLSNECWSYIAVPGDDNDVLVGVAARDVSVVTSGARGHVPGAARALLLMQGAPLAAERPPRRRSARVCGPLPSKSHRAHLLRRAHPVRGKTPVRRHCALLPRCRVRQ